MNALFFPIVKQSCICKHNIQKHKGHTFFVKMLTEYQEWSERAAFVIFNNISLSSEDNQAKMYPVNL